MLELLFVYCAHLMPNTTATADCMVELKWCAVAAAQEFPDRSFEDRVDNCAESIALISVRQSRQEQERLPFPRSLESVPQELRRNSERQR